MKLNAKEKCPLGSEITTEIRCRETYKWASSLGLNPERPVYVGNWKEVPYQCSAQVRGDDTIHFSNNSRTNDQRFKTGEFVMICEKG